MGRDRRSDADRHCHSAPGVIAVSSRTVGTGESPVAVTLTMAMAERKANRAVVSYCAPAL
ncbi:MAG: hypothetical protein ACOCPZ_01825 [Natrialbaceae archaeon]